MSCIVATLGPLLSRLKQHLIVSCAMPAGIDSAIAKALKLDPSTANIATHGSSNFASTYKITITKGDDVVKYFVKKIGGKKGEVSVRGEHESLNAINDVVPNLCPRSIAYGRCAESDHFFLATEFLDIGKRAPGGSGQSLAVKLAKLHTTPAPIPEGSDKPMFGFPVTTCCGETPQDNSWKESWAEFFAENRLRAILKQCMRNPGLDKPDHTFANLVEAVINKVVPRLLGNSNISEAIVPVVIHGDLWSGNFTRARIAGKGGSEEVVFDPSAVYGHSEYELGIMRMFGGFDDDFWTEYEALVPKTEPASEWRDRLKLYELYHHLNHYALFGSGYRRGCVNIMNQLINKYGHET